MRTFPILTLCAAGLLLASCPWPRLQAQDQLIRPSRMSLGSAEVPAADAAAAEPDTLSERGYPGDSLSVPLQRGGEATPQAKRSGLFGGPIATITGGLAITLGLFAVVIVIARRGGGANLRGLPREAFEVIGQTTIGPRQRLLIVRMGTQALVIGTSPAGIQRIAQIEDPDEAGQLIAQCRGMGAQAAFKSTLYELEQQPVSPGFVDNPATAKSGNLFFRA